MMRLCSFSYQERASYGIYSDTKIQDLGAVLSDQYPQLIDLLGADHYQDLIHQAKVNSPELDTNAVDLLPVIPSPAKIFCVGLNYQDHLLETQHKPTVSPTLFTRFADTQIGHKQSLVKPVVSDDFDFEAELAVIIGKPGRYITEEAALDHVAGYSCYNDGSVRDWQVHTTQFLPGKNFPGTGAFGPYLVSADEITDPQNLNIACRLNGQTVQSSNTRYMIHSVARLISYISQFSPLSVGDVIATGTPGGVGFTREPPLFMREGDIVEVEIEHIGILRNGISHEAT